VSLVWASTLQSKQLPSLPERAFTMLCIHYIAATRLTILTSTAPNSKGNDFLTILWHKRNLKTNTLEHTSIQTDTLPRHTLSNDGAIRLPHVPWMSFCTNVGTPEKLKSDRAPELIGRNSEFYTLARKKRIDLSYAEPERKNQIWPVDLEIRELKKQVRNKMVCNNVPSRMWDVALSHQAKLMQLLPQSYLSDALAMKK
jgi:hypothetical protein